MKRRGKKQGETAAERAQQRAAKQAQPAKKKKAPAKARTQSRVKANPRVKEPEAAKPVRQRATRSTPAQPVDSASALNFEADPWWGTMSEPRRKAEAEPVEPISRTRHERRVREAAAQRNRTRKRQLIVKRIRFAALIGSVILLGWLGYVVPRMGVFQIRTVSVEGASAVSDLLVRNRVDAKLRGETIFTVDGDAVVREVRKQPFVRSAEVDRHLPDGLSIRITEYEPLAFGVGGDGGWLVAKDGRVLTRARLDDWRSRVPVVKLSEDKLVAGEHLSTEPALLILRAVPPTFPGSIRAINKTKKYGYVAELHDGPSIRLGRAQDLDRKLSVAGRMLAIFSRAQQDELEYVDVTVPARPAVKRG